MMLPWLSYISPPAWWDGFLHLLYPNLCVACGEDLPAGQNCFCFSCRLQLEPTGMQLSRENEFIDRLWGRVSVENAAALYYFTRKSPVQRALHQLKYHDKPEVGIKLGREFGRLLAQTAWFRGVQTVVPVPLHPHKEWSRGYNQSAMFAQGLAETMEISHLPAALVRPVLTASQTKKKRLERYDNVENTFAVAQANRLRGKHVLLVDDVMTTGATLETCGRLILEVPGTKLSLATIAIAVHHSG